MADELLVTPALWSSLALIEDVPDSVRGTIRTAQRANTVRNMRFRVQLQESVAALNDAGVVPLLMKGARQLVDGSIPRLGERWLSDIDLAVPAGQLDRSRAALRGIGYRELPDPFEHPHELPLIRGGDPGPLELHVELGSSPVPVVLPVDEVWSQSLSLQVGDAQARVLAPTHGVVHNILHAAVQDLGHAVGTLPLRQLINLVHLVRTDGAQVDWEALAERFRAHGLATVLRDHLWLAHRFAGLAPPSVLGLDASGRGAVRVHEIRVLAGAALGWPPELHRNLRYAFGSAYLDSLYGHGEHRLGRLRNRAHHAVTLLRRDGGGVLEDAVRRRT